MRGLAAADGHSKFVEEVNRFAFMQRVLLLLLLLLMLPTLIHRAFFT